MQFLIDKHTVVNHDSYISIFFDATNYAIRLNLFHLFHPNSELLFSLILAPPER